MASAKPRGNENERLSDRVSLGEAPHLVDARATKVAGSAAVEQTPHRRAVGEARPAASTSPSSTAASSSIPPTSVASLIQSAAKISLLNMERPGGDGVAQRHSSPKLFQDDEYDGFDESSPRLQSLEKEKLPAMPDEQDRKRFVGCLAAVIASLYEYDNGEDNESETQNQRQQDFDAAASTSFYENMEDDGDDDANDDSSFDWDSSAASRESRRSDRNSASLRQPKAGTAMSRLGDRSRVATVLARTRHRQRRYAVFCRFLTSSADWLALDRQHGKCFLPVLQRLLVPSLATRDSSRWRSAPSSTGSSSSTDFLEQRMDEIEHLRPFLEELGPGAGLRCLAMFLLQHLLHSPQGYDARIRQAIKTVGVLVLLHDMSLEREEQRNDEPQAPQLFTSPAIEYSGGLWSRQDLEAADLVTLATRKFESLERFIALMLIELANAQQELVTKRSGRGGTMDRSDSTGRLTSRETGGSARDKMWRGLKIGGTAVAAGTLFAITGGLGTQYCGVACSGRFQVSLTTIRPTMHASAAPAIAAGIAGVVGTTAVAAAAAAMTTTAAVTTVFGVGGGGLVAYKMQRRTLGLTEFEFCKETSSKLWRYQREQGSQRGGDDNVPDAELFSTVCISGWLRDACDFQRPWGLTPLRPRIDDRLELLERFYIVHKPGHVAKCVQLLDSWEGEEKQLWDVLQKNYGRNPDHLMPLNDGPTYRGALSLEQTEVVDQLFTELGCRVSLVGATEAKTRQQQTPFERMQYGAKKEGGQSLLDSPHAAYKDELSVANGFEVAPNPEVSNQDEADVSKTKHLATVWDYQANFGGDLYTVRWESALLEELCSSVNDLAADVVSGATTHLLKFTALSALLAAVAVPAALKSAANMIDGTWTLVVERSDEAGRELAQSLLFSSAGSRPVTLVGFSFGARVIYSCLKELARYQEKWEDYHEHREQSRGRVVDTEEKGDLFETMREPASIVGDVILMGLPNHLSLSSWQACRQVVAGRLINCFSRKDLILSLMFQYKKFGLRPVCGTCPVNVSGVENFDVSDLVGGHQDYCLITGEILKRARHGQPFQTVATSSALDVAGD